MKKRGALIAALALGLLIALVSLGDLNFRPAVNSIGTRFPSALSPHRVLHLLAFGVLAALSAKTTCRPSSRILAVAGVIAFGGAIEMAEFLKSHNVFEFWDLRDDSLGALLGLMVLEISGRLRPGRNLGAE